MRKTVRGLLWASLSGVLYGAATVGAKATDAHPLAKAAVMSAASAALLAPALRGLRLQREDRWKAAAMVVCGGALAPALILYGLRHASALHAGLLLTLELVATAALALLFLRERVRGRAAAGLACLLGAAVLAALSGSAQGSRPIGLALVACAAIAWAVDVTVSTVLTGTYRAPQLIALKSSAALLLLVPAWAATGLDLPDGGAPWAALLGLGALVALASVVHYRALPAIGAARTIAVNVPVGALATAAGAALLLGERLGWQEMAALALVAAGVGLLWEPGASVHGPAKGGPARRAARA